MAALKWRGARGKGGEQTTWRLRVGGGGDYIILISRHPQAHELPPMIKGTKHGSGHQIWS